MKRRLKKLWAAIGFLTAFVLWTLLVCMVDVKSIGPLASKVGFATFNGFVHDLTGVHMVLYTITDWLGLVPIGVVLSFAILGLIQWIKRKSLMNVDRSLFVLGGFYVVMMVVYALFELVVINYRPVLIDGCLEVSYPSSTTLLVTCVMPTALLHLWERIKHRCIRLCAATAIVVFIAFMVIGRLISGVHWVTDIIGGALLSAGLVLAYACGMDALNEID